jgi:hypothetical protein
MVRMIAVVLLLAALALVIHAEWTAPDPYAACERRATDAERAQCRNAVDFALSAGW